jgi:hypothetical protein
MMILWAALWLAAASCAQSLAVPAMQLQPVQSLRAPVYEVARTATASAPAVPDPQHALIVGNAEHLELWSLDGTSHRTLSVGPALHPRRLDADTVVALSDASQDLQRGTELVRISLHDGSRTLIATLPAFRCSNDAPDTWQDLDVQDALDFRFDASGNMACLDLMDRNANMADVSLKVRVELDSGSIQRWLGVGEPECIAPAGVSHGEPSDEEWCGFERVSDDAPEPTASFAFDYDDETGWVKRVTGEPTNYAQLPDYMREKLSPSGRWLVLGGDIQEGDYIHRSLVLFDRAEGSLYPVLAAPGPWPLPLTAAKAVDAVKAPSEGMADVVGESDVRWLSVSPDSELLIVDQLVISPLKGSWAFEGELAH